MQVFFFYLFVTLSGMSLEQTHKFRVPWSPSRSMVSSIIMGCRDLERLLYLLIWWASKSVSQHKESSIKNLYETSYHRSQDILGHNFQLRRICCPRCQYHSVSFHGFGTIINLSWKWNLFLRKLSMSSVNISMSTEHEVGISIFISSLWLNTPQLGFPITMSIRGFSCTIA